MEVKKQEGGRYSVSITEDVQLSGALKGHIISATLKDKAVTVEFAEDWNKVTVRDGVLARDFTRVPVAELATRIEQYKQQRKEEKKRKQAEAEENGKLLAAARGLLTKGKYAEARAAFENLAVKAPEHEPQVVAENIKVSAREAADQQRLEVAEQQLGRGEVAAAEQTLSQTSPETLQATRRGALLDKVKAAKGRTKAPVKKKKK
jgi:hypothetical protein